MISVIIPNNGYDEWLPEALGSIDGDVEVIVEEYKDHVSLARNRAVERCTGSHLLFLDADDILKEGFFNKVKESDSIVATGWQHFGESNGIQIPKIGLQLSDFLGGNQIIVTSLIPKKLFNEIGGFRELDGYEDWDLWVRAMKHGATVEVIPEPLVLVRLKERSRNKNAIINHNRLKKYICE